MQSVPKYAENWAVYVRNLLSRLIIYSFGRRHNKLFPPAYLSLITAMQPHIVEHRLKQTGKRDVMKRIRNIPIRQTNPENNVSVHDNEERHCANKILFYLMLTTHCIPARVSHPSRLVAGSVDGF